MPTLGADFVVKEERLPDGRRVQAYLWDIAGNPAFNVMRQYYLHGAHCVIACFALDDLGSFRGLKMHLKEVDRIMPDRLPVIVAGTKGDLEQVIDQVEIEKVFSDERAPYVSTSAKTGENVNVLFLKAITMALR